MKKNKVKINILSPGRFHVCDLARELDKNGFDVKFYSFVPARRAGKFGLPRRCCKSLIGIMAPFLVLERKIFTRSQWAKRLRINVQDYLTGIYMRRCDVCIAMSGSFLSAIKRAKKQGSIVILERGSKHILEQKRILDELKNISPTISSVPDINVKRELAGYEIADYLAIPSKHVKRSFAIHNYPLEKLFLNPYGVNVSMFHPAPAVEKQYDMIMVGGWSLRKGCDLIVEAVKRIGLRLLHVGGIVDLEFPKQDNFTHIDPVDEKWLPDYYHKAKVFILPSREEGLALVQAQAIASNLPIIGSPDSGAEDLKEMVESPEYITIIQEYTVESVCSAIQIALNRYQYLGYSQYAGNSIENLTWEAYGKRYAYFLNQIAIKL